MEPLEPPPNARHRIASDGEIFVWQPRRDIVVEKGSGILTLPLAQCLTEFFEPLLEPDLHCQVFGNFERLTHYTREAREHLSLFVIGHLAAFGVIHFLISAKFVALGLSSFKQDIGSERVRFYSERESFEQSYLAALAATPGKG